jgi:hypothetical protein
MVRGFQEGHNSGRLALAVHLNPGTLETLNPIFYIIVHGPGVPPSNHEYGTSGFQGPRGRGFQEGHNSGRLALAVHLNPGTLETLNPIFYTIYYGNARLPNAERAPLALPASVTVQDWGTVRLGVTKKPPPWPAQQSAPHRSSSGRHGNRPSRCGNGRFPPR